MNFLKKLREASRLCTNPNYTWALQAAADEVAFAISDLYHLENEESLIALNGAWAKAQRIYDNVPPEAQPTPPVQARKAA